MPAGTVIALHSHTVICSVDIGFSAIRPCWHHYVAQFSGHRRQPENLASEVWRQFTNGYEVSNRGRVRSRRMVLANLLDSRNEPLQKIRGKYYRVKRLVAEAFIPNPAGKRRVRHINGRVHDCRADNLEWW